MMVGFEPVARHPNRRRINKSLRVLRTQLQANIAGCLRAPCRASDCCHLSKEQLLPQQPAGPAASTCSWWRADRSP